MFKEIRFPHSLGLLYSAFTYYLGFKVNSAEYKVMGLAPYGKPVHFDRVMKEMVQLNEDGSFKLNMDYFSYDYGLTMTNGKFSEFFGGPPRKPESWMTEREFDIAPRCRMSAEVVLRMVNTPQGAASHLCWRGVPACVATPGIVSPDENFSCSGAGDAGARRRGALSLHTREEPARQAWTQAYWSRVQGPRIKSTWTGAEIPSLTPPSCRRTAEILSQAKWWLVPGRMESARAAWGPRILADHRDPKCATP